MSAVQVHPSVYRINAFFGGGGAVQCYLLVGSKKALVDTGVSDSPDLYLEPALRTVGLSLSDIDLIINTHGHLDHLGGNGRVKEASDADVLIHRADAPFTEDAHLNVESKTVVPALVRLAGRTDLLPEVEASTLKMVGKSVGVDRVLEEGDRVDLGNDVVLEVIHTPGHTAGSCTFYWEKERLALTGDSVQARGSRAGVLPLYFLAEEYMQSQRKLLDRPIDTLCLGHAFGWSGPFNDPVRRGADAHATIKDALDLAETIDRIVANIVSTNPDVELSMVARQALDDLRFEIPLQFDRQDYVPYRSLAPIHAHLQRARG